MKPLLPHVSSCALSRLARPAATGLLLAAALCAGAHPGGQGALRLEPLVVTGTRTPQAAGASPVRVGIVAGPQAEKLGARSLADAMEFTPGVQVESTCQTCNTTEIRLMGLGGSYNQIAFGGLPLLSSLAGVYGVEQVPAAFIERIEVVKGGGSSLYGASAVAGVVNIIPRMPARSGSRLDYRFESVLGVPARQAGLIADHVSDDATTAATAHVQTTRVHPVDLNADGFTEITRRRLDIAGLRFRHRAGRAEWTGELNHIHEVRRGGNHLDLPFHLANIAEALDTRRTAATLAVEFRPSANLDYRLVAAVAHTERASFYGGLGDIVTDPRDPAFDAAVHADALAKARRQYGFTRNPLLVADAQFNHRLGRRTLSWGLQAEHEKVDDRNLDDTGAPTGATPLTGNFTNVAVFVQDDWAASDRWTVLSGVRVDRSNQLDDPIFSPRLALKFSPEKHLTLRGSLATGFRAPRVFDEDLHIETLGAEPIRIVNAADLRKEGAVTANLGAVWNPRPVADRLAVEANVFAIRLRDAFQLSEVRTAPDGSLWKERFNTGGVGIRGAELSAAWSFSSRLRADIGLAWQHARLDQAGTLFDDGAGTVVTTRRFNKTPGRFATLQLQYENPASFDWALGLRHMGPMRALNNRTGAFVRTPSFLVLDASVGRHFAFRKSAWEIRLGVRNVTDDRQKDLETGAGRDADYVYGPRQPRTFFTSLSARF